jgi:hypothetical protein
VNSVDLGQYEPFLPDRDVDRASEKVRSALGHRRLENVEFVTFLVPARTIKRQTPGGILVDSWIGEMVVLGVLSPNPRRPTQKLLTSATVSLTGWLEAQDDEGKPDHAFVIFKRVAEEHLRLVDNLRDLIN